MSKRTGKWSRLLVPAAPLVVTAVLGVLSDAEAGPRGAAAVAGRLTLPFAARWGEATLPAGDYSFTLDSLGSRHLFRLRGADGALLAPGALNADPGARAEPDESALVAVRRQGRYTVHALRLVAAGLQLTLSFPTGEAVPDRRRRLPILLQRVPVQLVEP